MQTKNICIEINLEKVYTVEKWLYVSKDGGATFLTDFR